MKITKIIKDNKQTRTTVPADLVKGAGVESGHMAEWKLKKGRLSASVISHKEFMEKVDEAKRIENRTKKTMTVTERDLK